LEPVPSQNNNSYFKDIVEKRFKPLDEVLNEKNLEKKEILKIETAGAYYAPPTFGVALTEENVKLLVATFTPDDD